MTKEEALKKWQELQPEIEAMTEMWDRLQAWAEENDADLNKCSMRSSFRFSYKASVKKGGRFCLTVLTLSKHKTVKWI